MDNILHGTSKNELTKVGGIKAVTNTLNTSLSRGIDGTPSDLKQRTDKYGDNLMIEPKTKTLWEIFLGCFEDFTLQLLIAAAIASLIIGISTEGWKVGWYESVAILVAVVIVVTITTVNDYEQTQQFKRLFKKSQNKIIKVLRGGKLQEIDTQQLVVGDIFEIETGLIMPADGILLEKHGTFALSSLADFLTDEAQMTGESKPVKKCTDEHPEEGASPFLISGSKINEGSGFGVVLAVGTNSQLGILRASMEVEEPDTPLQLKLTDLSEMIGNIGMGAAVLTVIGCTLGLIITCAVDGEVRPH